MLTLTPDADFEIPRSAGDGFVWWYLDAMDAEGSGLVLIWSWGLPFLPGARGGREEQPARPSINLCLYDRGRLSFYLLHELAAHDAAMVTSALEHDSKVEWRFGPTRITSHREGSHRRVEVEVDLPVPGGSERLKGRISLAGVVPRVPRLGAGWRCPHRWTPLCAPATVHAELTVGDGLPWRMEGSGYHDRNHSTVPLERLGIRDWAWGRIALPDRESVHYLLWPDDPRERPMEIVLDLRSDGAVEVLSPTRFAPGASRRSVYGMRYHGAYELAPGGPRVEVGAFVDDGPFYLRYPLTDAATGAKGWGERVRPAAVDLAFMRPLVRMRVHREGHDSPWLPLFSGPRRDRVDRFLRQWWLADPSP